MPAMFEHFEVLARLEKLERLQMNGTGVFELAPLAPLTTLRNLSFDETRVADLAPLAAMTELEHLSLSHTKVMRFDVLGTRKLRSLYHYGVPLTDDQHAWLARVLPDCKLVS
jgi:internalin A